VAKIAATVERASKDSETVFVQEALLLAAPLAVVLLEEPVVTVVAVLVDLVWAEPVAADFVAVAGPIEEAA